MLRVVLVASFLFLLVGQNAPGQSKIIPQIGKHYPLLILEKSENRQNLLVTYVELNAACEFAPKPELKFYWLMDGSRYKPLHPLIASGVRKQLNSLSRQADGHGLRFNLALLNRLVPRLPSTEVSVRAWRDGQDCRVECRMPLAKNGEEVVGHDPRSLQLERIYSESRKVPWPPFRKVTAVRLEGTEVPGNHRVSLQFRAL